MFERDGFLRNVASEVRRARRIKCAGCGRRGAATGCRVDRCQASYHLPCAREGGCAFFVDNYMIACPAHVRRFRREVEAEGG